MSKSPASPPPPVPRDPRAVAESARRRSKQGKSSKRGKDDSRWLWPFELGERIGEGGMGVVYKARYVVNDRQVAVKMLPDDVQDPVLLARFEQELEILKDLKHPNIVRCFGGVSENDHRFYAMELVEGGCLEDDLKRRGKLPWEQVVAYAEQMSAALQASHAKGVIHRDVKPGNFLKTASGQLKLSDFGLARIEAGRRITRAGKTAGTVLYMAPEQIRGLDVTPVTDLYALGCVLYELLSGRTPFMGESAAAVLQAHVTQTPQRLGQFAMDCPPALEELVHQLLEKAPDDRPASAAEVGIRLSELGESAIVSRRDASLATRPSSRPTSIPADEKTRSLPATSAISSHLKAEKSVPGWALPAAAVAIALFAGGFFWQMSTATALRPWQHRWEEVATTPGPYQAFALSEVAKLGERDEAAIDLVISQLKSSTLASREAAAEAAQHLRTGDMKLIGQLNKLAKSDENDSIRYAAKTAVTKIRRAMKDD